MEFITLKNDGKNTIKNISNSKYIVNFLSRNNLLISVANDLITFGADSIISLDKLGRENGTKKILEDKLNKKFIYDIGSQILELKEENLGITYFSLEDIVVINSSIFLFINPKKIFHLLSRDEIKIERPVKSYTYGVIDSLSIKKDEPFIAPELLTKKSYIYYTTSFYSLAKMIINIFDMEIDSLYYTSIYYFLKRCLEKIPEDRIFLYI